LHSAQPSEWLPDGFSDDRVAAAADLGVEMVKEQLFRRLSGELPYELQPVATEARKFAANGALLLKQTIFVRSESVRRLTSAARSPWLMSSRQRQMQTEFGCAQQGQPQCRQSCTLRVAAGGAFPLVDRLQLICMQLLANLVRQHLGICRCAPYWWAAN